MDGHAEDRSPDFCAGRGCEKKLILFTAVESEGQRIVTRGGLEREGVDGQRGFVEDRGESGFFANMGEVGGEAVADVDDGVGERAQTPSLGEARLGVKMRMVIPVSQTAGGVVGEGAELSRIARKGEEFGGGSAKGAGDVKEIA